MTDRHKVKREGPVRRRPKTQSVAATASDNGHEATARRAYDIFERRGHEHGRDLEDWLQAERELRETKISLQMAHGAECSDGRLAK